MEISFETTAGLSASETSDATGVQAIRVRIRISTTNLNRLGEIPTRALERRRSENRLDPSIGLAIDRVSEHGREAKVDCRRFDDLAIAALSSISKIGLRYFHVVAGLFLVVAICFVIVIPDPMASIAVLGFRLVATRVAVRFFVSAVVYHMPGTLVVRTQ